MNFDKLNPLSTPTPIKDLKDAINHWKEKKNIISIIFFCAFILRYIVFTLILSLLIIELVIVIRANIFTREINVSEEIKLLNREYTEKNNNENPKSLEIRIDNLWKRATSIPIEDESGKRAIVGVYTSSTNYYWLKGQNTITNINGKLDDTFIEYLKQGYSNHNEIICIGNSSYEEISEKHEEYRSYYRALYLSDLLQKKITLKKIEILPIGKCKNTKIDSDSQRTVIILRVKKIDSLVNMNDALYLHLLNDKKIPYRFWDYSLCKDYETFYNPDKKKIIYNGISPRGLYK